jgi:hypothetical protein
MYNALKINILHYQIADIDISVKQLIYTHQKSLKLWVF